MDRSARRPARTRLARPMAARSIREEHRVSTPLELLFDLTFAVAVSRAAGELAHALAAGGLGDAVPHYLMVFFGIWWAWMNFTWFASAYDVDDVPYRLLTLVQMAGVLVLATGVPAAFEHDDFGAVTAGYVIMRLAMVAQWLRASGADAQRRGTAVRFAVGVGAVQLGWVLRLSLPHRVGLAALPLLVIAELLVPVWAERRGGGTTWHPHHIAERYGLFTIIVLGECVLAVTAAVAPQAGGRLLHADLVLVAAGGLVLLFTLWWIYFLEPAGTLLDSRRDRGFVWGYGHFGIFAALAALGAALEVAAERAQHHVVVADAGIELAVAVPVAAFLVLVWALHAPASAHPRRDGAIAAGAALATLAVTGLVAAGLPLPWAVPLTALPPVVLAALAVLTGPGDGP